jgi:hypothetical protein
MPGNEYGVSPLMLLEILSPFLVVGPAAITLLVFGPLLLYPLARWKTHRAGQEDPQLGIKVLLDYFALIAFQLALIAAMILIFTLVMKSTADRGDGYRVGFALAIPAGSVLAAHLVLLKRTNQDQYPIVRRLFLGYNLAVTGLIGFVMLVFAFQVFFRKGSAGDAGRLMIAGVLVYVGAWVACGVQFGRLVLGDAASGPPSNVIPPPGPIASMPTQPSGPQLPSLSAGTYPPIDQK